MRLAGVTRSASEHHEDFLARVGSFYDAYTVLVMLCNGVFHIECYLLLLKFKFCFYFKFIFLTF